jgi:hypothetical protein
MSKFLENEQFMEMCLEELLEAPEYIRKMVALRLIGSTLNEISLRDACESAMNHKQKQDEEYFATVEILAKYRGDE